MKRTLLLLLMIILLCAPVSAMARRLYYAEEFYLYVLNLYYTNPNLERNIRFMQWALKAPFDNPVRSLALITTENEFKRYKSLFRMHVNLLIIDSYLQLARRFDKEHVYFFNLWYAQSLKESFQIAKYYYTIGLNYWTEALTNAQQGNGVPGRINIDEWEDELIQVLSGELDYEVIINDHLEKLGIKMAAVEGALSK
ncbi:MAG: hypothetical protein AMS17_03020 [Spirochaetes bacterium DG_61]|jgi:hypothetical protein|nr:MAG: hypothetical protein AMS17_03020 [Spirochaetes bacterium DG_61]